MSETNSTKYTYAAERPLDEQRQLTQDYDEAGYELAQGSEADYEAVMATRELEKKTVIEARVMDNATTRRMYMMAQHIAELRTRGDSSASLKDKEDKLEELLVAFVEGADTTHDSSVDGAYKSKKSNEKILEKVYSADDELQKRKEEADFILEEAVSDAQNTVEPSVTSVENTIETADMVDNAQAIVAQSDKVAQSPEAQAAIAKIMAELDSPLVTDVNDTTNTKEPANAGAFELHSNAVDRLTREARAKDEERRAARDTSGLTLDTPRSERRDVSGLTMDADSSSIGEDVDEFRSKGRMRQDRLRSWLTPSGISARFNTLTTKAVERGGRVSRRNRLLGAAAGLLMIGGGILLMRQGHDISAAVPKKTPELPGTDLTPVIPPAAPKALAAETLKGLDFTVEPGHGYEHELSEFATANGHHLSGAQAHELYKATDGHFGHDFIDIKGSGNDVYPMSDGNYGLAEPGKAKWAKGVAKFASDWMKKRGL